MADVQSTETTVTDTTQEPPTVTDTTQEPPTVTDVPEDQSISGKTQQDVPTVQRNFSVPTLSVEEKRNFYRTIFSPCKNLSDELKDKAKAELNETEEIRSERISELRKLISESVSKSGEETAECFRDKDDGYLVRFLRTKKFDVKKTFQLMTAYAHFRVKHKTIADQLNIDGVTHALSQGLPGILPYKDKQGRIVLIYDTGSWDMEKVSFDEMLASFLFLLENLVVNEENQIRGFVFLETYEKYQFSQALQMKASDVKKLADMLQGSFPGRFKGFHVIRQPWYFSMLMTLAKPFMGSKLSSRIFVHGFNLKGLYDWIKPEHLPESYGGIGQEYDPRPLLDELQSCLMERDGVRF